MSFARPRITIRSQSAGSAKVTRGPIVLAQHGLAHVNVELSEEAPEQTAWESIGRSSLLLTSRAEAEDQRENGHECSRNRQVRFRVRSQSAPDARGDGRYRHRIHDAGHCLHTRAKHDRRRDLGRRHAGVNLLCLVHAPRGAMKRLWRSTSLNRTVAVAIELHAGRSAKAGVHDDELAR